MTIRKISYAGFRRNITFWIRRQERGEDIRLMRQGEVVGILYGEPMPEVPGPESKLRRHQVLFVVNPRASTP